MGLLRTLGIQPADDGPDPEVDPARRAEIERLAMAAVIAAEEALGFVPRDVSRDSCGYDIESRRPDGRLRLIEVKGLGAGNDCLTITRNELLHARNTAEWQCLAIVGVDGAATSTPCYISGHDFGYVSFAETSRTYSASKLLTRARASLTSSSSGAREW